VAESETQTTSPLPSSRHAGWVRFSHWIIAAAFLTLVFSGFEILMVHPRLYWGEVGNDLTEPILELPISRNYKHGGYESNGPIYQPAAATQAPAISASRTFDIFNQNGWGRSLHFLAGWFLVIFGSVYFVLGIFAGHFRRNFLPSRYELTASSIRQDVKDHLRFRIRNATGGPDYGLLQKASYLGVVFLALPLMFATGITMSPAVAAAFPFLLDIFGGHQSARTVHFFAFAALAVFLLVHTLMVAKSGFRKQMRGMTLGVKDEQ
jgi:thiosulfate reductase cytochrome b subunit